MAHAAIKSIEYYLPSTVLSNEQLAIEYPGFSADKIFDKTGIRERRICDDNQFSSDMAIFAATSLFESKKISKEEIDFLILCTQTPDYILPTTACIVQDALGLNTSVGAMDINLGCSGFVYGLSMAKGLIETNQAKNVLLLTAETYSKLIEKSDKSVRTIFGDGAAATLISGVNDYKSCISPIVFGTDGSGWMNLCVRGRGLRGDQDPNADPFLRMQGPEIFRFTLDVVPNLIKQLLSREGLAMADIDLFVFHQANHYILDHLRKKIGIPSEKLLLSMEFCANTVSSTIPIALKDAQNKNILSGYQKVMLIGFGVGYSWAGTIVDCELMM